MRSTRKTPTSGAKDEIPKDPESLLSDLEGEPPGTQSLNYELKV